MAVRRSKAGRGVDDVVESLFADGIQRADITAQDLPIGQPAAGMLIVDPENISYTVCVAVAFNVAAFLHRLE